MQNRINSICLGSASPMPYATEAERKHMPRISPAVAGPPATAVNLRLCGSTAGASTTGCTRARRLQAWREIKAIRD